LEELYKASRKLKPFGGALKSRPNPVLVFRAGPLPDPSAKAIAPLVPYGYGHILILSHFLTHITRRKGKNG